TLLVVAIRFHVAEPTAGSPAAGPGAGSVRELVSHPVWGRRALLGLLLAAVGLGTFWGVTIEGQNLAESLLLRRGASPAEARDQARFAYGLVQATGGGLG